MNYASADAPAMKNGAIGFTVDEKLAQGVSIATPAMGPGIDVRTGAGNFLSGLTPSHDILADSKGTRW
jgi:hypothetical protein